MIVTVLGTSPFLLLSEYEVFGSSPRRITQKKLPFFLSRQVLSVVYPISDESDFRVVDILTSSKKMPR